MSTAASPRGTLMLGPAGLVWLLGVSQILGYGTLYYSFAILVADMARTFDWPVSWLFGSFSLALLAGGLVAPVVGRMIDRHGAGLVMVIGSAMSAVTLVAAASAPNAMVFTLAIVALEIAASLVLYDAAFAALVQATGQAARRRITHLTLIAGFASTLFWPLTSWLHTLFGWREILLAFAALNFFVCLPIHALVALQRRRSLAANLGAELLHVASEAALPPLLQRRLVWLVTIGLALSGFALSAVLSQMVPLLSALGLGASALLVSTLFGPAQVLVRFVNMLVGAQRHPLLATLIALGLLPVAILTLMLSAALAAGAVLFAVLLGFGSGLKSIVQGTLPLALFGSASYGTRLGTMASVRQGLAAIAPFALASLIDSVGAIYALAALAVVAGLGFAALVEVARLHRKLVRNRSRPPDPPAVDQAGAVARPPPRSAKLTPGTKPSG